jgi:serine/threonine protein kinase
MLPADNASDDPGTAEWSRLVERIVQDFERAWQAGQRASRDSDLYATATGTSPATFEPVPLDPKERLEESEAVRVETYLADHPEVAGDPYVVVELLAAEYRLRRQSDADVAAQEYFDRFPAHRQALAGRLSGHAERDMRMAPGTGLATSPSAGDAGTMGDSVAWRPTAQAGAAVPSSPSYEVLGEVGRGGMGIVYRARDRRRGTVVALKTLPRLEPAALYRFKQEFRALADVVHPNLVTFYELVADGRQWFLSMEFVHGIDFLTYVRAGSRARDAESGEDRALPVSCPQTARRAEARPAPLKPEGHARLRHALRHLSAGVQALHAAGKLHRDVKPPNVLVTAEGRVVLLDFGLAAELDAAGRLGGSEGGIVGTIAYMAPEQAAGMALTPACDWYSVGAMLYAALVGHPPFFGPAHQVLCDKSQRDPPPPSALVSGVPEDLDSLCVALLQRRPEQRPGGPEVLQRLGGPLAPPTAIPGERFTAGAPLVGRVPHLQALTQAFQSLRDGQAAVVHICGRSGVGKTALLQRFLDDVPVEADGEVVILLGRCYEHESVPYKAVDSAIDALCGYLRRIPRREAEALIPREVWPLARIFPVLRGLPAVGRVPRTSGSTLDPHELRRRAFAALRELLFRLGQRRRLIVAIDDLQWGDADSASLLADLLRPPDQPALLLLGSYRSEDEATSPFLRAFLASFQWPEGRISLRRLGLEPLAPQETRELALALLGRDDPAAQASADAVARESGGNPFFVGELVQHALAGGKPATASAPTETLALEEALWRRIATLPADARRLLEVATVFGGPLRQEDACAAAELEADERPALAVLRAGRLLRGTGAGAWDEIESYHDRVRETVVAHLAQERRVQLHGRLAQVLEAGGQAEPEVLAGHFQKGGDAEKAAFYHARAADCAAEALAFDHAARLYRQALAWTSWSPSRRQQLQIQLGDALANAGRGAEAAEAYQVAAEGRAPDLTIELKRRAALQLLTTGHVDEGLLLLQVVLSAAGTRLASAPWRALVSLLLRRAQLWLRGLRFRERPEQQLSPEELRRIDICWSVVVGLSIIDPIRGADFQTRNLLLALRAGEPFRIARALAVEAGHLASSGSAGRRRAAAVLDQADRLARRVSHPYALAIVELARGTVAYFAEQWPTALEACSRAETTFREHCTGVAWEISTANAFSLWSLTRMGQIGELNRRCPALLKEAQERGDRYAVTNLSTQIMTLAHLAADDPEMARRGLESVMNQWSQKGYHIQHHDALLAFVPLELYCGQPRAAWDRVLAEWSAFNWSLLSHVQDLRIEMLQLRAFCALAVADCATDPEPFLRAASRDARKLRREGMPWTAALAAYIDGTVAALRGHLAGASQLLADAVSQFDALEARLHAAATRRCLSRVVGGQEGAALLEQADAWMKAGGVKNPDRMTAAFAPGLPRPEIETGPRCGHY